MSISTIEETFNCPDSPHLDLSNIRGSVNIQPGEAGVISVIAHKHLNSGDEENTKVELTQTKSGEVKVRTHYSQKGFRFFRKWVPCKVDYHVRVPKECTLDVHGVSNSTNVKGVSGNHSISSVSGEVHLDTLAGELKLKVVNGDVQANLISAPVRLETVSGDVNFKQSNISTMTGKTVSGDVIVESNLGDGPYSFNSVSGDIRLYMPGLRRASITSSSISGKIRNSSSAYPANQNSDHNTKVGGGAVEIRHKSVSGDIFLVESDDLGQGPDTEKAQLPAEKQGQSRSEILDQVDRGELSVAQALEMLASESGS